MIFIALGVILALSVVFTISREWIGRHLSVKICAICAAVATTWAMLLILRTLRIADDSILLGILMGESVTGLMYLFDRKAGKNMALLNTGMLVIGTYLVYIVVTGGLGLRPAATLMIMAAVFYVIYAGLKGNDGKGLSKEVKKLEKKLEHCCD